MGINMALSEFSRTVATETEGFRFLCRLFAAVSVDRSTQYELLLHADQAAGLSNDAAMDLSTSWLREHLPGIRIKQPSADHIQSLLDGIHGKPGGGNQLFSLIPALEGSLDQHWEKYTETCRPSLVDMLHSQSNSSRDFLDFLALGFALSAGTSTPKFRLQHDQIRQVLQLCLMQIDMPLSFALPDHLDLQSPDTTGCCTELQEFLAVCVAHALYAVYSPRKEDPFRSRNTVKSDFFTKYCQTGSHRPDSLVSTLWARSEALQVLRGNFSQMYRKLRTFRIGHFSGPIEQVFQVPSFVTVSDYISTDILFCDKNATLKQFFYGGQVGKSTFLRMIMLCCVARHPFFSGLITDDHGRFDTISHQLSLNAEHYFPLLLDCLRADESSTDPISEAIRQLCIALDAENPSSPPCQRELQHRLLSDICDQQLREQRLLLLIDNWDHAPAGIRNGIYHAENAFHILIASNHRRHAEMRKMDGFNYCMIREFSATYKKQLIDHIASNPPYYHNLLKKNRYLNMFTETPAGLFQLLNQKQDAWDAMITREISCQMEQLEMPGDAVRQFFHQLALSSLEGLWKDPSRGASDADHYRSSHIIPGNLMKNSQYCAGIFPNREKATLIWEQTCRRQVLVCAADVPSGYQFKNPLFRYSLAADAYRSALLGEPERRGNSLIGLSRLSPTDFSYVIVLLMSRICSPASAADGRCSNHTQDVLHTLCQCIAGYVLSLTDMDEAVPCCQALADILSGSYSRNLLSACTGADDSPHKHSLCQSRLILLRCYAYLYHATYSCHAPRKLPKPEVFIRSQMEKYWFRHYYPYAFVPHGL